ncbi:MBL fold metallo-hydrolase [Flagellimonas meridianipacifica]|uniref:Glyoxylase-like metal-dependent hydrolase (Beta-lactamase superfamily II) n=1 Tax=Flagellimonas meridianipacifica TaxID=1080225 RepID=A0A2T0MBU0_9FLAO|nr:MBL fold metallo-hydrolase [Allomuricauda pacifica]PRX54902.1 glyoxylase-like metal-dependent hydrolase (beta-lactamase superfamily II) [Allomuricauda pacifica]
MATKQFKILSIAILTRFVIGLAIIWFFAGFTPKGKYDSKGDLTIFQITQSFANIFVVEQDGKLLMIDSGNPHKGEVLESKLMDIGIDPSTIDYLILTHAHPDHAGNAHYFKEKFGIRILVGFEEEEIIKAKGTDKNLCPRGPLGLLIKQTHAKRTYEEFVPDIRVKDSFDLSSIGFNGFVQLLPGHTPGSLYVEMGDAIFVGDLIRGQTLNKKKPAYHLFMCNLEENLKQIKRLADKTHIKMWYPGHGGPLSAKKVRTFIDNN